MVINTRHRVGIGQAQQTDAAPLQALYAEDVFFALLFDHKP